MNGGTVFLLALLIGVASAFYRLFRLTQCKQSIRDHETREIAAQIVTVYRWLEQYDETDYDRLQTLLHNDEQATG